MFGKPLSAINLLQWIEYTHCVEGIEAKIKELNELPPSALKTIRLTGARVDLAIQTTKSICGMTEQELGDYDILTILQEYDQFIESLSQPQPLVEGEVTRMEDITFGQFIDAKMLTQGVMSAGKNKWELLQYVIAIFASGPYKDEFTNESSEQFIQAGEFTLDFAIAIMQWFEQLNETIHSSYTLFQDDGEPEKENMKEHMRRWGWVNFLKSIAKTKVFDIAGSGMNSIDCARAAKMTEVLTWASEEKDYNIAVGRDFEDSTK